MQVTRRQFLKAAGAVTGGGVMITPLFQSVMAMGKRPEPPATLIPTYCEICFWKCGAFAKVVDGKVVKVDGNPTHPNSRGKLCARGNGGLGLTYDPDRIKTPLISTGKRGEGKYRQASWEEALNYIAERMLKIKQESGPEAVSLFAHGCSDVYFSHLFNAFGSPNISRPSFAQCRGPRDVGYELTFGEGPGSPERVDLQNSRIMVLFGSHLGENMHNSQVQDFVEGLGRGARLIVVDPRFSTAAGKASHWLPIRPGADLALILTWINIIIKEGRYDKEYVDKYATGFKELAAAVGQYTPEWAEKETDLSAQLILETAREIARYSPAVCIHPGRHATWHGNDVQRSRAMAILTAITGAWGREGGIYFPTRASFPKLMPKPYPQPAKPALYTVSPYPFAGAEGVTNVVRDATNTGKPYPVKAWVVVGTNLLKAMPNQKETLAAIEKLDLLVSIDVMPFDTAMYSDVILPECSYLERADEIAVGRGKSLGLTYRKAAIKPMYESRDGYTIARELAKKLDIAEYFPWETVEDKVKAQCAEWKLDCGELEKKGFISIPDTAAPYITPQNQPVFATASKKIELYSKELKEKGFDPIPKYEPIEQPTGEFFRLIYGRSPVHTFSRTTNNQLLHELHKENEAWVSIKKAKSLGLKNGDYVVLVNQDGAKSNKVKIKATERIREDCIYLVHGFDTNSKSLKKAYHRGADDQGLITRYVVDPICGSTGMRVNFVKIVREA